MPTGTAFGTVGQAVLVPGMHYTSSYLCVASAGAEQSLYSACHGAGTVIDQFARAGRSAPAPRTVTSPTGTGTARTSQSSSRTWTTVGVDAALAILVRHDLVRPVARMRPLAVLN